ncbi:hypothetical protein AMTRI_Chr02g217760 [Amborella trichopoda]|uniref:Uncharacterized protein n=1 Tax=Amborella trichopoda TaxID=13333 RepID=W1PX24_AMBTC|nr:scarecrow-like protein 21 [Amborella trichopoda]XP_011625873.1 scarecrow-like protein 21 [Amborella trichopoda]XP_020527190.1 scarecrow-like protein 21 [Amborella trichopoda]ERN12738.1 hypothetical protein AMTR_s00043p00136400 [Amborella trichopoda]|eukprot:XP_006851157.1 scarecrow-like protein 21 [Amborella trichopoda]
MDMNELFSYGGDISYAFSTSSSVPSSEWVYGPMKFNIGSSPDSPLSTQFDYDTLSTTLSNSQEQFSSTENHDRGISPSHNSSLDSESVLQRSPHTIQDRFQASAGGSTGSSFITPGAASCIRNMKHALLELESALMAPDDDEEVTNQSKERKPENTKRRFVASSQAAMRGPPLARSNSKVQKTSHGDPPEKPCIERGGHGDPQPCGHGDSQPCGNVRDLLIECAKALSQNEIANFERLISEARNAVSISGKPIQRLGAYMLEGLVARQEASGSVIYRSLKCEEPMPFGKELLSYMHKLYEICPYFKFGYMAANGAIAEAFRTEDWVHIIDFQIAQGTQWVTLIQALAARPSGPPHVRITGIDDPVSKQARGKGLEVVGERLKAMSEKFGIPVEFNAVPVFGPEVELEMLDVRPGEALAVNFTLQLHHTPDESVDVRNPRDDLLRRVKALSPKVMTLVEHESNTNTAPFLPRFMETLEYYSAMFESIDVSLARDSKERINVEQHCLARDIVNIVACEGRDRIERHELLAKWRSRLMMAGFRPYPLSGYVNSVIRSLLKSYSENYTLEEKDGALLLGWKERNLISASAWQ